MRAFAFLILQGADVSGVLTDSIIFLISGGKSLIDTLPASMATLAASGVGYCDDTDDTVTGG